MDIREYIEIKSKQLGIDIIGFTDAEPLSRIQDYLVDRKDNLIATEFEEKDLEKRINPKLTMPNCSTIIVIGLSYNVDYTAKCDYKIKGALSKSSWGIDYHRVLRLKIENLIKEIKKEIDFEYKYFVDTGPLVERELAYKAGIGYYGKNSSIINDIYGSFIFLGYILTDIKLKSFDVPIDEKCGDCDLCLKACPTGALNSPYRLNARKCISYLTQTKDDIDYELMRKMGIKIYGCDTCQKVCPKNKKAKHSSHSEFIPDITKGFVDIEELMEMSNKGFKEKYGHMSGSWRGRNILKRNSIIALGNTKDKEHIEMIYEVIKKENPFFNNYTTYALNNILSMSEEE